MLERRFPTGPLPHSLVVVGLGPVIFRRSDMDRSSPDAAPPHPKHPFNVKVIVPLTAIVVDVKSRLRHDGISSDI